MEFLKIENSVLFAIVNIHNFQRLKKYKWYAAPSGVIAKNISSKEKKALELFGEFAVINII